jgi:hypothetical protein
MKTVPKGKSVEIKERIKADGTIEKVSIKFYQGQQLGLHVMPEVIHKGELRESLITYPSDAAQYLSGDNDYNNYAVVIPVRYDDYIRVYAENIDATYDYTLNIDIEIDYYGGVDRVV